jgi:hypothetical protein
MQMRSILRSELKIYTSTAHMEHYRSYWLKETFDDNPVLWDGGILILRVPVKKQIMKSNMFTLTFLDNFETRQLTIKYPAVWHDRQFILTSFYHPKTVV